MRDLTGQRFGRLLVLKPANKRRNKSVVWECTCDCGNSCLISSSNLVNRNTRSCGCLHDEKASERMMAYNISHVNDLTGKIFGRLTVLRRSKYKPYLYKGRMGWLCKCDCGKFTIVDSTRLIQAKTISCGCYAREVSTKHGKSNNPEYVMWCAAKKRAKEQGVPFTITVDDIVIPEFCPVFPEIRLKNNKKRVRENSPTLDKLIPSLGYTKENIRVISQKANTMKQRASYEEIKQLATWLEKELSKNCEEYCI